jgi:hypothetical protein
MKANELRIGNLIYYSDKQTTCSVTDITISHIYEGAMAAYPIPLTEEWLLKFGFRIRDVKTAKKHVFYSQFKEHAYGFSRCRIVLGAESRVLLGGTVIPCSYVHQLQNLYFALTGEELTIK